MIDEKEWAIVVWANPKFSPDSKQRFLETITGVDNSHPLAFPLEYLRKTLPDAIFSENSDITSKFNESTQEKPLIVTLQTAKTSLGLENFAYSQTLKEAS